MDENFLSEFLRNNDPRIADSIAEVLSKKKRSQTKLVAMDFDECVIIQHISRMVTQHYWDRAAVDPKDLKDNSIRGIANLFHCYVGLTDAELDETIRHFMNEVIWRDGAIEFLQEIMKDESIFPLFVSSGLAVAVRQVLHSGSLEGIPYIACELSYENNIAQGCYTVVSDTLKGDIVRKIIKGGGFEKVITVGHSKGDVELIKAGSKGYRISLKDSEEAMAVADHVIASWGELNRIIKI